MNKENADRLIVRWQQVREDGIRVYNLGTLAQFRSMHGRIMALLCGIRLIDMALQRGLTLTQLARGEGEQPTWHPCPEVRGPFTAVEAFRLARDGSPEQLDALAQLGMADDPGLHKPGIAQGLVALAQVGSLWRHPSITSFLQVGLPPYGLLQRQVSAALDKAHRFDVQLPPDEQRRLDQLLEALDHGTLLYLSPAHHD